MLDFGIAKLAARDPVNALRTQTGVLMGTPLYMSPEQCRGTKQVDFRSDIYSLGLIVYQMLAGAPPFVSEGLGELLHMHMNVRAAPLSDHNPAVGPTLGAAVARAIEKDPAARHASMKAFQEALVTAITLEQPRAPGSGVTLSSSGRTGPITAGTTTLSANAGQLERGADPDVVVTPRRGRAGIVAALVIVLGVGRGLHGARVAAARRRSGTGPADDRGADADGARPDGGAAARGACRQAAADPAPATGAHDHRYRDGARAGAPARRGRRSPAGHQPVARRVAEQLG